MTKYRTRTSCNLLLHVNCRQTIADFRINERFTESGSHTSPRTSVQSRLVTQLVRFARLPLFLHTLVRTIAMPLTRAAINNSLCGSRRIYASLLPIYRGSLSSATIRLRWNGDLRRWKRSYGSSLPCVPVPYSPTHHSTIADVC